MRSLSFLKQPCHKAHLVISSSLTYGTPSTTSLPVSQVSSWEITQFLHHHSHPSLQPLCPPATNLLSSLHLWLHKGCGHKWSNESDGAFSHLGALFTATSILTHPNPSCQFMDEVDLGNRELLAVVFAFRSGDTGWSVPSSLLWGGLTTGTCPTSRLLSVWPPGRHAQHSVLATLCSHLQHQDECPVLSVFPWSCKLRAWSHPISLLHHWSHFLASGSRGYWRCNERLCLLAMPPTQTLFCPWFCPLRCPAVGTFLQVYLLPVNYCGGFCLPPSIRNSTILMRLNQFTKAAHFVPLRKLPSAVKTLIFLVWHVFHL